MPVLAIQRVEGWESLQQQFFSERVNTPFVWGESDCCLLVADYVRVMTGVDIAEWFRGRYTTRAKAFRLIKEYAGKSFPEMWDKIAEEYGLHEVKQPTGWGIATISVPAVDPVAARLSNGVTVAIKCPYGTGFYSQGKNGIVYSENPEVVKAWAI